MKAGDIMNTRVVTIRSDATIAQAIRLMLQNRISGLPVVDAADSLVGIVTEGDFLRRTEIGSEVHRPSWLEFLRGPGRSAENYVHTHSRKVADVMTTDVVSATEATSIEEIVNAMEKRHIKRVPVLRNGKIAGIVSRANLLHALAQVASEVKPTTAEDTKIRDKILADLNKQAWAPRTTVNVIVREGIVNLNGVITDERERAALRVMAENIPGVKKVRDRLVWIEPVSGFYLDPPPEPGNDAKSAA